MQILRSDEGTPLQVLGDLVTIKLHSTQSPHGQAVVTVVVPPGSGTPCVTHDREEEVYFMLEGELLMHTPDEMAESVHQLPRDLTLMQSVMAEHGVARVV